jgi:hypothetical protein
MRTDETITLCCVLQEQNVALHGNETSKWLAFMYIAIFYTTATNGSAQQQHGVPLGIIKRGDFPAEVWKP